jgi:hypothetical protein
MKKKTAIEFNNETEFLNSVWQLIGMKQKFSFEPVIEKGILIKNIIIVPSEDFNGNGKYLVIYMTYKCFYQL